MLYEHYGSAKAAWQAKSEELRAIGLGENRVTAFEKFRREFDTDEYLRCLQKLHIGVITIHDPRYPRLLCEISDTPFLLYVKGRRREAPVDFT